MNETYNGHRKARERSRLCNNQSRIGHSRIVPVHNLVYVGGKTHAENAYEDPPASHASLAMFPGNPKRRDKEHDVYAKLSNGDIDD